jgi:flagellin-like hook-associated protein FlgL
MSISGVGNRSNLLVSSLVDMRARLDDLQRQLGTGDKSTTYAGLGPDRGLAVSLRNQLNLMSGYSDAVKNIGVRINLAQSALSDISDVSSTVKAAANTSTFNIDNTGQTVSQRSAVSQLDQVLTLLNTQAGDRYLFSGRATNQPATQPLDLILNGDVSHAGFKQVLAERKQADLGANGLGRLQFSAATSTPAALTGTGATISADAPATVTGSQNLSLPYTSAGGTLTINGTSIAISPGDDITAILSKINAPAVVAQTGVTATAPGGTLTLTGANADTAVDLTGTSGSLATEFGVTAGVTQPNNLLTQVPAPVTQGQTLTVKVGSNPTVTITFGTNQAAVPPEVSTLAELNAALGTLTGATASVGATGNITITAGNTTDAIALGGTANPAKFGLTATSAVPSNVIGLTEETPVTVFGFKLANVSTTSGSVNLTGPTTPAPAMVSADFFKQPLEGDQIKLAFNLPDGTSENIVLTATTQNPPGPGQFQIGTSLAATSANFQTALNTGVSTLAATSLTAASAIAASNNFFDVGAGQPPMRVNGPPFDTATGLVAGTAANTVTWYTGEMGTDPARGTAVALVDNSLTVSYGARANEQALTNSIKSIAVYASMTYTTTDPNAQSRYYAVNQRVGANLAATNGQQQISDISAELAFAQSTMTNAQKSEAQRNVTLTNFLQGIEQANPDEVSAQLLALQTQLQASLQTTAMLYKLSIVNYIS